MEDNKIVLDKSHYKTEEDFQLALASLVNILTNNHYSVLINQGGGLSELFSVEFLHDPQSERDDWGYDRFIKVTAEEEENILNERVKEN